MQQFGQLLYILRRQGLQLEEQVEKLTSGILIWNMNKKKKMMMKKKKMMMMIMRMKMMMMMKMKMTIKNTKNIKNQKIKNKH
jgi:hypothetical protein